VVNVSLDTEMSIVEEHKDPILPAEPPYQRKRIKHYRVHDDGLVRGQFPLDYFDFDEKTLTAIARQATTMLK